MQRAVDEAPLVVSTNGAKNRLPSMPFIDLNQHPVVPSLFVIR